MVMPPKVAPGIMQLKFQLPCFMRGKCVMEPDVSKFILREPMLRENDETWAVNWAGGLGNENCALRAKEGITSVVSNLRS